MMMQDQEHDLFPAMLAAIVNAERQVETVSRRRLDGFTTWRGLPFDVYARTAHSR